MQQKVTLFHKITTCIQMCYNPEFVRNEMRTRIHSELFTGTQQSQEQGNISNNMISKLVQMLGQAVTIHESLTAAKRALNVHILDIP